MSDKPKRIQLRRSKGWRMPPNTVKVDRSTRWGNVYRVERHKPCGCRAVGECDHNQFVCETAEEAVEAFRTIKLDQQRLFPERAAEWVEPLRGKNLACWCPPGRPCHADVLLELANRDEEGRGA